MINFLILILLLDQSFFFFFFFFLKKKKIQPKKKKKKKFKIFLPDFSFFTFTILIQRREWIIKKDQKIQDFLLAIWFKITNNKKKIFIFNIPFSHIIKLFHRLGVRENIKKRAL